VRDRWNLVRLNPAKYRHAALADVLLYRNVPLVQRRDIKPMVHRFNAPRANARNPSMFAAQGMEGLAALFIR
jgi:hypothetical protein